MRIQVGRKRLGLALGAGGVRGVAHIGVLGCLQRHGIIPATVAGSSAGAVIAAFAAVGYTPEQMTALAVSLQPGQIYDPNLSWWTALGALVNGLLLWLRVPPRHDLPFPQGLLKGQAWEDYLQRYLGDLLCSQVQLPLAILSTDVNSGASVVFSQVADLGAVTLADVPLARAVRASSAIPGVFRPVHLGALTLVDGGVKCSVPAALARQLGADVVLAVDLAPVEPKDYRANNIHEIILQSLEIMEDELTGFQLAGTADLVLRPIAQPAGLLDFDQIPQLIAAGDRAMEQALPELQALLGG